MDATIRRLIRNAKATNDPADWHRVGAYKARRGSESRLRPCIVLHDNSEDDFVLIETQMSKAVEPATTVARHRCGGRVCLDFITFAWRERPGSRHGDAVWASTSQWDFSRNPLEVGSD